MDNAGNTLAKARTLRLGSSAISVRDAVGPKDSNDYYQVRLKQKSRLNFKLSNLKANVNLELLNAKGSLIQRSSNRRTQDEVTKELLEAGTYYVRAFPKRKADTTYKLTGSAIAKSTTSSTFDIQFDYRFDSTNWFTSERRALLNQAAKIWEDIIQDEFSNIASGEPIDLTNPTTGVNESFNTEFVIDDLLVFVGAGQTGGALALGGPFGQWFIGSEQDTRFNEADFEPWTGDISFDPNANWFFDSTPNTAGDIPNNANDFLSVAVHELGHVLGIGTSDAFDNLISSGNFAGANTKALNSGQSVPLDAFGGHVKDSYVPSGQSGEAAMDPTLLTGSRKLPSALDLALLNDIGYGVDYSKSVTNDRPLALSRTQRLQAACACGTCLMGARAAHRLLQQQRSDRSMVMESARRPATSSSFATEVLRLTNRQRGKAGLEPLTLSSKLTKVAQSHSIDMAQNDFMGHTGSDGSDLGDRLGDRNYLFAWANENVAAGYATPREVIKLWLNSPPHRANLLSSNATELGLGYKFLANDTGTFNYNHYWTLVFGRPLTQAEAQGWMH